MKSIYEKIILVLVIGFAIQVIIVGVFYKQVAVKRIISEINAQEDKRRTVMEEASMDVQKFNGKTDRLEKTLDLLSVKYKTGFVVKSVEGDQIYSSNKYLDENSIQEQGYVKLSGKIAYIVYGYFPPKIISLEANGKQARVRYGIIIIIFFIAFITLVIIYKTLAGPLKKLSKAVSEINYGNTKITIPYYGDDELGLLCRNFENMGERLSKSEKAQQELIQAISHDVKTPLTSIIGYSKRLLDNKVSDEKKVEYYEIINRKANNLKTLLEELDDFSNYNYEAKYDKKIISGVEYTEGILKELREDVSQKGGELHYEVNLKKGIKIHIDEAKMKRVLGNIIDNSMKYSEGKANINVFCSSTNHTLYFEICDSGIGVPEDQLSRIFDRFYRVDSSRSRESGGTGLGLAICKEIVEMHSGKIGAKKSSTGGLCIWFELPVLENK